MKNLDYDKIYRTSLEVIEGRFPKKTVDELRKKGHKVSVDTDWSLGRMTAASKDGKILKTETGATPIK